MSPEPESRTQETWLSRVEALLAKAESSTHPPEAEAFFAKAQELMARHAIDEALLTARGRGARDAVEREEVVVSAPYASAKSALLANVASANGCRVVSAGSTGGGHRCIMIGHASDLARVRTLHAALATHATRTMVGSPVPPGDSARRFRHAFLVAFAFRIGERLQAAALSARAEATAAAGDGNGVALVMADRTTAVDLAVREAFPRLGTRRVTVSSRAGSESGRRAADRADLERGRLPPGGRRSLGR